MRGRGDHPLALVVASLVLAFGALALPQGSARAGAPQVPLSSPPPGGPAFVSFTNRFEDSLSSTLFDIVAQGTDLAYVWSLQNVTCGSLAQPQTRDARNAYVHPSCATSVELPVRVQVVVARASDLNADGTPKNEDVPRFVYSQVARAMDSPDTTSVPKSPQLQYFGPAPAVPTTTSRPATSAPTTTSGPGGGGDGLPVAPLVTAGGIAAVGAGTVIYLATRRRVRQGSQTAKYECSLHIDLDPKAYRGGMGHGNANLKKTLFNLDADGKVISAASEETIYDFAPKGNAGLFDVLIGGTPGKVLRHQAHGGGSPTNWYQEITQEGYEKGKAWADATVANPPTYRGATNNCVDYARQVCIEAGGSPPSGGTFVSTPADLVEHILSSPEGLTPQGPPTGVETPAAEGH